MIKNITKNTDSIFKRNKDIFYLKENIVSKNIEEKIKLESESQEEVYIFEGGVSAKFLGKKEIVDKLSINYFQIYDKDIRNVFDTIKKFFDEVIKSFNINKEKSMYYISSNYENNFEKDCWYDCGGDEKISLCGYYFLNTGNDSYIVVDDKKIDIDKNDLILFFAGKKILFNNIYSAISFNIAPLSHISGQYPQKWMPL